MDNTKMVPVKRISQIEGDVLAVVAVWGPMHKDETHEHFVRGVPVSRTSMHFEDKGRMYRWCRFPDGRTMVVNEGNIVAKKIRRLAS